MFLNTDLIDIFVIIMIPVTVLHFLWGNTYGDENVALNRPTLQSSLYYGGASHRAADGNLNR